MKTTVLLVSVTSPMSQGLKLHRSFLSFLISTKWPNLPQSLSYWLVIETGWHFFGLYVQLSHFVTLLQNYICASGDPWNICELLWLLAPMLFHDENYFRIWVKSLIKSRSCVISSAYWIRSKECVTMNNSDKRCAAKKY